MTILRDPVRRRSTFPTYLSRAQEEQAEKCGICILTFSVCQMFNGVQSGLVLDKRKQNTHPCCSFITLTHWTCVCICVKCRKREEGKEGAGYSCSTIKTTRFFVSYVCFLSQLCLHPPVHTETRGEKKTHPSPLWRRRAKGWVLDFFFPKIGTHALYVWYCLHAFPPIAWAGPAWRAGRKTAVQQPLMFLFYGPMSTHCLLSPFVVPLPN